MPASRVRILAHQALAHGGGRDEKGGGNLLGGEAENRLQDQRRAHAALDRRMRAGEHQRQAPIRDALAFPGRGLELVGHPRQVLLSRGSRLASTYRVRLPPPGDREQPGVRVLWHAIDRPRPKRLRKGVAERILRARHVARPGRKESDEAAIALAGHTLGGAAGLVRIGHFQLPCASTTGRISIAPYLLEGQRLAQAIASSRSSTVTKK
jgi:hypothetical protein